MPERKGASQWYAAMGGPPIRMAIWGKRLIRLAV
jgi:hypothetical protein